MSNNLIGQKVAGKYRVAELWRETATSRAFRAVQIALEKSVTLKVLRLEASANERLRNALEQEAKTLARIANPHILNVLDTGADESGAPFLVLESVSGVTLAQRIKENAVSSLDAVVLLIRQASDALAAAHSNNIVHGDLSADKILLEPRGNADFVKVLDFGANDENDLDDERTVTRGNLPFYQSPEKLRGETIDARSDVYSLAVILFEALTGRVPFSGADTATVMQKHLADIPPSLIAARPDLPPNIEQVLQRALAKNPEQRFQSANDFADALAHAAVSNSNLTTTNQFGAASVQSAPVQTAQNDARWKTAFIILAGISLLSLGLFYFSGSKRANDNTIAADGNAQPVQPIANPVTSTVEDANSIGTIGGATDISPLGNSATNPTTGAPAPGGISGVPQGIPPGLYPPGRTSGPVITVGGSDANGSIFTTDALNPPVQQPANGNVNAKPAKNNNANAAPAINANAAPPAVNAQPKPSPNVAAPKQSPTPKPAATPTAPTQPKAQPKPTASPKPNE